MTVSFKNDLDKMKMNHNEYKNIEVKDIFFRKLSSDRHTNMTDRLLHTFTEIIGKYNRKAEKRLELK